MIRFDLGEVEVTVLDAGRIRLDGGAMFGVVPRPLWERERAPDARNRIELGLNVLLVSDGRRRILVDSGAGLKWDDKSRDLYGLEPRGAAELLAPAGLVPEQVDLIVSSHLHFDHAGGNTVRRDDGALAPAFPNAEYLVQRGELEFARRENERIRASYRADDFEPLAREGRLRLLEGDVAIDRRVRVEVVPGHVPHLQAVFVESGGTTVCFASDLVPTASHVPYPWIMGYDLEPLTTLATKRRILPRAAREGWLVVFPHDARVPVARVEEKAGKLRARPAPVEA